MELPLQDAELLGDYFLNRGLCNELLTAPPLFFLLRYIARCVEMVRKMEMAREMRWRCLEGKTEIAEEFRY
jgi:hypothetical protein